MKKLALLVGVSHSHGLRLKGVSSDVAELRTLLLQEDIGAFDDVQILTDPNRGEFEEQFERLCHRCERDDLLLFYFSGPAEKDDFGKLYLTNCETRQTEFGRLRKASATSANYVHDVLGDSRAKRQVIILDCCFSGAIAHNWTIKDNGSISEQELEKEGRAVLVSATSTEYSIESNEEGGSIYTRQLIHGLRTGEADRDGDGWISVEELHEYAFERLRERGQRMTPQLIEFMEGRKIKIAKSGPRVPAP